MNSKKKASILITCIAFLVVLLTGAYAVYSAYVVSFSIKNQVVFNSEGVFCQIKAKAYYYTEETFQEALNDLKGLHDLESINNIGESYYFDNSLASGTNKSTDWNVGDLDYTINNKQIIYLFYVENLTEEDCKIQISFDNESLAPDSDGDPIENKIYKINSSNQLVDFGSQPITLEKCDPYGEKQYCYFALIATLTSLEKSVEFTNNFSIDIQEVNE